MRDGVFIEIASELDVTTICRLAHAIWWPTYRHLLPLGQVSLMLERNYSEAALREQFQSGQCFSLAMRGVDAVGFVGFQHKPALQVMRIEKLYVLPTEQGKGTGRLLIDHVAYHASVLGVDCLELNVYRHNPAKAFYEKQGFSVVSEIDIPYHGYVLSDYIMRKQL